MKYLKWFCYIEKLIEWQNSRKAYKKQTLDLFFPIKNIPYINLTKCYRWLSPTNQPKKDFSSNMTANHVVKKLWWVSSSYTIKTAPSRSTTNITKVESTQKGYWEISQYISEANFHSILRWIGPVNPHPNGHGPFLHFCMTISVRNSHWEKRPKMLFSQRY